MGLQSTKNVKRNVLTNEKILCLLSEFIQDEDAPVGGRLRAIEIYVQMRPELKEEQYKTCVTKIGIISQEEINKRIAGELKWKNK